MAIRHAVVAVQELSSLAHTKAMNQNRLGTVSAQLVPARRVSAQFRAARCGERRRSGLPRFVSYRPLTLFGSFSSCFNTVYIFSLHEGTIC